MKGKLIKVIFEYENITSVLEGEEMCGAWIKSINDNLQLEQLRNNRTSLPGLKNAKWIEYTKKEIRKEKLNQIENKNKLIPCPFCGESEEKNITVVREGTNRQSCQIRCENCGCTLESNEIGYGDAWNRRVTC